MFIERIPDDNLRIVRPSSIGLCNWKKYRPIAPYSVQQYQISIIVNAPNSRRCVT